MSLALWPVVPYCRLPVVYLQVTPITAAIWHLWTILSWMRSLLVLPGHSSYCISNLNSPAVAGLFTDNQSIFNTDNLTHNQTDLEINTVVHKIREDQFEQCFDLVMSLWPKDRSIRVNGDGKANSKDSLQSSALYLDIYYEVLNHMEDMDCRLVHIVQYGVFQAVQSMINSSGVVTRDCVDKERVRDVLNQSRAWRVAEH